MKENKLRQDGNSVILYNYFGGELGQSIYTLNVRLTQQNGVITETLASTQLSYRE